VPRCSCPRSDLRASHQVCFGGLVGTCSPKDIFWLKSHVLQQFCNKVVKSLHFMVAEREGVKSHKRLFALIFVKCKFRYKDPPMVCGPWDCIKRS